MAVIAFPTYAFNATAAPQVVASQAALNALGAGWVLTPFVPAGQIAPFDPGFPSTDIRLQQLVVEMRIANQLLYANAIGIADDPAILRADVLATDATLTS